MEHARASAGAAALSGKVSDPGSAWFGAGARSASSAGLSHNVRLIAAVVAAFVSVLGLALFLHLYICHVRRRNRRRLEAALPTTAAAPAPKGGLDAAAIAALPTAVYGKGVGGEDGGSTECTICLGAVEEGDTVRLLPACNHVFHVPCVDTWLTSSSSCPVCRAGVEPPPPPAGAAACVQEKPQDLMEKEDAAGTSAPVRAIIGASLIKMLSRERPLVRRPQVADAADLDLERQQPPQTQQQQEQAAQN